MGIVQAKSLNKTNRSKQRYTDGMGDNNTPILKEMKARVDVVHVDGLQRTKDDVVSTVVKEMFKAQNFQQVILQAHKVRGHLEESGCFKKVEVYIDTNTEPGATPDGLQVTFQVKELRRISGDVNTSVSNNEAALNIGVKAPNLLGRGERIQLDSSFGSSKTNEFCLSYFKPIQSKIDLKTSLFQRGLNWSWSGYRQTERGLLFDFSVGSSKTVQHNVQYEAAWRDLKVTSRNTAFEVREDSGHTLKSAVRYIISKDTRDSFVFPSSGSYVRLSNELAGLGGNIGFLKNELYLQINRPVVKNVTCQGTFQCGFIKSFFTNKTIAINDKFFYGGPMSIRGFKTSGIGPRSDGSSLGALCSWGAGLHLFTPLPFKSRPTADDIIRLHFFTNIGNCDNFDISGEVMQDLQTFLKDYRLSYGCGLAVRLGQMVRIEFNYVFPYAYRANDQLAPGLQLGIGLEFL